MNNYFTFLLIQMFIYAYSLVQFFYNSKNIFFRFLLIHLFMLIFKKIIIIKIIDFCFINIKFYMYLYIFVIKILFIMISYFCN